MAKLDAVLIGMALLIFVFICLLIFNRSDTIASLVPLASIIVGFSFIFGHSAQTLFESVRAFDRKHYLCLRLLDVNVVAADIYFLDSCL